MEIYNSEALRHFSHFTVAALEEVVMADAAELVEVRHTLRQVVNVKGD